MLQIKVSELTDSVLRPRLLTSNAQGIEIEMLELRVLHLDNFEWLNAMSTIPMPC